MNTVAHAVVGLAVLSRQDSHKRTATIVAGALIPDLAIILFYAWHRIIGTSEDLIWSIEYFRPTWQAFIDSFNSIPVIAIGLVLCWKIRHGLIWALFASMMLHCLTDLPVHHDDGHRHFFPFSDWRFVSPISYWDSNHYGHWFSLFEALLVSLLCAFLWIRQATPKVWIVGCLIFYLIFWIYAFLVWN